MRVRRALISVSDKTGIATFARFLSKLGVEIISTGGTAKLLSENKIVVKEVSDVTGFDEILDGRVKTLHPKIHGGLLALRDKKEHMSQLSELGIEPINLVIVNLYPFQKTILKKDVEFEDVLENIDIGGSTLIRASAKNHKSVAVIVNPAQYGAVMEELKGGELSQDTLYRLAVSAFAHSASYDATIHNYLSELSKEEFPELLNLTYKKVQDLRYGENPYQRAAFYSDMIIKEPCVGNAKQLHGRKLSYNNILDINDAFELISDFEEPTVAVIKHSTPSGVSSNEVISVAYENAYNSDPISAYGSIIALNRPVDLKTASSMRKKFVEAVIAPSFEEPALKKLCEKENIRLLETGVILKRTAGKDLRKVRGGLLIQTNERPDVTEKDLKQVSKKKPTEEEISSMLFAFRVNNHVKSNSIVIAKGKKTVGIGAGQMSRVDAVKIAVMKAEGRSENAVLASDAFFPFRDGIDEAAKGKVTAIIQPGGSIRDKEIIDAVDEHGMAMVFTGVRCFKH